MMINLTKAEAHFLAKLGAHTLNNTEDEHLVHSIRNKVESRGARWDRSLWKNLIYKFEPKD